MDAKLQELLDKKACEEVLMRYGRTLDWLDYPGQATCYWPDAYIDYGFLKSDCDGWVTKVESMEPDAVRRWHMTSNSMIKVDGDTAFAESYTLAVGTGEIDGVLVNTMFGGRLMDDFEKRGGEWRISKRVYAVEWISQVPDQLSAIVSPEHPLNTWDVVAPGHPAYRPM